jgi:hypothetical protein
VSVLIKVPVGDARRPVPLPDVDNGIARVALGFPVWQSARTSAILGQDAFATLAVTTGGA